MTAVTALNMTTTRIELLRAVKQGKVEHHRLWNSKKPDYDLLTWAPGATRRVTADVTKLAAAKLIEKGPANGPSMYAPKPWKLTEAGEKVLAELDTRQ